MRVILHENTLDGVESRLVLRDDDWLVVETWTAQYGWTHEYRCKKLRKALEFMDAL